MSIVHFPKIFFQLAQKSSGLPLFIPDGDFDRSIGRMICRRSFLEDDLYPLCLRLDLILQRNDPCVIVAFQDQFPVSCFIQTRQHEVGCEQVDAFTRDRGCPRHLGSVVLHLDV